MPGREMEGDERCRGTHSVGRREPGSQPGHDVEGDHRPCPAGGPAEVFRVARAHPHPGRYCTWLACAMIVTAAACGDGGGPESGADAAFGSAAPAEGAIVEAVAAGDGTAEQAADTSPAATPSEIHYDLTVYDWYRRGEPLVHAGRSYHPVGPPVPSPETPLTLVGRYQGVTYYAPEGAAGDPVDAVYVPVFEGYWLRFVSGRPLSR